ncbi:SAM-dependent methyltransferase [Phytohabitans rumicis]|uniref:SAM-dependent methyltransferase n=1 Tax=Phytohabitans rumicis TaxID=1076125 RepID=UPI0031ED4638
MDLKSDVPHSARIYDYLLGGKDNFQADREAAAGIAKGSPNLPTSMRANRNYMARVAHYLAAECGFRQFLDVGTGLPTAPNLHEVVQGVAPESRVVYVDNDPIVLVHARALLTSSPEGRSAYIDADFHDPAAILNAPEFEILDLSQPIALCLLAIVHFIPDDSVVQGVIDRLMKPLAPGSALALSTATADSAPEEVARAAAGYHAQGIPMKPRTRAEVEQFFTGMELVDPGVTLVNHWHADDAASAVPDAHVFMHGGVAIKP